MSKLYKGIKLKTELKFKEFVKAKVDWSKYGEEKAENGVQKVILTDQTDELIKRTRLKTELDLLLVIILG